MSQSLPAPGAPEPAVRLRSRLVAWLSPPDFPGDEERTRRGRLLHVVILGSTIALLLYLLLALLDDTVRPGAAAANLATLALFLGLNYCLKRGWVTLAGVGAISLVFTWATLLVIIQGTIRTPATAAYTLVVVLAGALFGWSGTLTACAASSLAVLALISAGIHGWLPLPNNTVSYTQWVTYTTLFAIAGGVTLYTYLVADRALARSRQEIQQRSRVHDLVQALAATFSVREALALCLERTLQASDLDCGGIYLADPRTGDLDLVVWSGLTDAFVQNSRHVPVGSPRWQIVMAGQPIYTVYDQIRTQKSQALLGEGLRVTAMVPLLAQGRVIACFNLASHQVDEFTPTTRMVIEEIALQVGHVLARVIAEEDQQRTLDELRAANLKLERAMRSRDDFMAAMSHELRTPLTGILGMADVLKMDVYGCLNEKQVHAVEAISQSGLRLLELINNVLVYTEVQSGKMKLQLEPCSLVNICRASLHAVQARADEKGQRLELQMDPAAGRVNADERLLRQMLVNLLENAIKFTPQGGEITLAVAGLAEAQELRLSVTDTGIGIAAADQPHLFQPFVQLDARLSRQYQGAGLGLALVLALAELHGGRVTVESVVGQGSTFTLILPWSGGTKPDFVQHANSEA